MEKDVVIIGGGPGGYVAAIRGAQLGAKVTLIEDRELGGTCLNRGCIPTKALYKNAEVINTLKNIEDYGISISDYSIDIDKIQSRKQNVVDQLVGGIEKILESYNVEVISGLGTIKDKNTVIARSKDGSEREVTTKNIIIATGSKPFIPPIPGTDLEGVISSDEILNFKEVPKRMAIIGGGVIGAEFAGIFNALNSEVTVIEFLPNILGRTDADLTKRLAMFMKKQGMNILTSTKVTEISKGENGLIVKAEGKKGEVEIEVDTVLVSVGRAPVTEGLNLDNIGIEYDRRGVKVDHSFETNVEGIYAIGDVNGGIMLAHVASHEGITAVETIMGVKSDANHEVVPSCIFVSPEIATVGLTEEEVKEQGLEYKVSKFMFGANGKALAMGEPEGLVKVISTGEENTIVGVHIIGPHAADLIHEGALAVSHKLNAAQVSNTIHAHPTLGEAFVEAVLGLQGQAIHMAQSKRK